MTLETTVSELLGRTQLTHNQREAFLLLAREIQQLKEAVLEDDELGAIYELRQVERSNWYEVWDVNAGVLLDKINGLDNARAYIDGLDDSPPTADDIE